MGLEKILHEIFLKSPANLFDAFLERAADLYQMPAHTLLELRQRDNKKVRGDVFEEFCALYLKHVMGYEDVWLLSEVPEDILKGLGLVRKDMGIDIIVRHGGEFYAVQCKYKKREARKTCVTWQALSTFYALCLRTGPYKKYIVMTTCDYTRHQGKKTAADTSICVGSFRKITGDQWLRMCSAGVVAGAGAAAAAAAAAPLTPEELRQKRLQYFETG